MTTRSIQTAYAAATRDVLIARHPDPGVLIAAGKDRLSLLHRMSTNDVEGMSVETIRRSVLTNPIARIVDVLRVISLKDKALLLTSPGRWETVLNWLLGYIFFQDDVQLTREADARSEWGLYGPSAAEVVSALFPGLTLPQGEAVVRTDGGFVWQVDRPAAGGYHLLLDPETTARASERWSGRGGEAVDAAAYQILRIEAGLPEMVHEIRSDSIPLEVGLREAISFSKGCYIGQEIIARMDSRGRQAHVLVGLRLSDEARPGETVYQDEREVGELTSVARSPESGWIALASVRPGVLDDRAGLVHVGPRRSQGTAVRLPMREPAAKAEVRTNGPAGSD